ncbi:MAG: hypothetical protein KAH07_07735 [Flavobacteriaceae bacterium]|nr:hypothetical protein [Flavobacteriaceae bacterium]
MQRVSQVLQITISKGYILKYKYLKDEKNMGGLDYIIRIIIADVIVN